MDPGLSQTQALVFAAADDGDCGQLLSALAEARRFCAVSASLEAAAENLRSAEEAMLTLRCLADAVRARDRHEAEAWLEQARGLHLEVPPSLDGVIAALRTEEEQNLRRFEQAATERNTQTTRELLEECKRRGLNTAGCTEREDLLRLLQSSSAANPETASRQDRPAAVSSATAPPQGSPQEVSTVWDRRVAHAHVPATRKAQALYLLGVNVPPGRRTTTSDVRAAYRKAALECHPDRGQNHARQAEAVELFQRVKEAFDYLNGPEGGLLKT